MVRLFFNIFKVHLATHCHKRHTRCFFVGYPCREPNPGHQDGMDNPASNQLDHPNSNWNGSKLPKDKVDDYGQKERSFSQGSQGWIR